eukprot:8055455-Lingulodinium_polyedra.AAC.1
MSRANRPSLNFADCAYVQSASASAYCVYVHAWIAPASMPKMHVGRAQAGISGISGVSGTSGVSGISGISGISPISAI